MTAKDILIRALDCISVEGYVTKEDALINDKISTSKKVMASFDASPELSDRERNKHSAKAQQILDWIGSYDGYDDYLMTCKNAIAIADTEPKKAYGYICALVPTYDRMIKSRIGLERVLKPEEFAQTAGKQLHCSCEVINVQKFNGYRKVSMVDGEGHLITYTVSDSSKRLKAPKVGSNVMVSARVSSNRLSTPCETILTRPTINSI